MKQFNPWEDAAELARHLNNATVDARLVVVLTAAWCQRCLDLRPFFDSFVEQSANKDAFVWLDIDEHASLIGDYVPDDLPEVLVYRQGRLAAGGFLSAQAGNLASILELAPQRTSLTSAPDVWTQLATPDWATT